jgi:hypothetical protein
MLVSRPILINSRFTQAELVSRASHQDREGEAIFPGKLSDHRGVKINSPDGQSTKVRQDRKASPGRPLVS